MQWRAAGEKTVLTFSKWQPCSQSTKTSVAQVGFPIMPFCIMTERTCWSYPWGPSSFTRWNPTPGEKQGESDHHQDSGFLSLLPASCIIGTQHYKIRLWVAAFRIPDAEVHNPISVFHNREVEILKAVKEAPHSTVACFLFLKKEIFVPFFFFFKVSFLIKM